MFRKIIVVSAVLIVLSMLTLFAAEKVWKTDFTLDKDDLAAVGSNHYFFLRPGFQLYLKSDNGDLTITVLQDTKMVDGIETRVVEERETENGKLIEVSRNYFAVSKTTGDVYYFGEDVDNYNDKGKITGHGGSWLAGMNGAKAGLMMPGTIKIGDRYHQEVAPEIAMDRAEIVSTSGALQVPAGKFNKVLKVEETTPLEPGVKEYKYYTSGIGLLKDGDMQLVRYGYLKQGFWDRK